MRIVEFHDHLNPTQVVPVDADSITGITPFGSGSAVTTQFTTYGVHETPAEAKALWRGE
jgi:hypothetical protein